MNNKIWNLKYRLGNTDRIAEDSGNPQSRKNAIAGAKTIVESNGWEVWVEHHETGARIFESAKRVPTGTKPASASLNPTQSETSLALAQAESWMANPRIRPTPEQAREVAGFLAAEIRRLQGLAPIPVPAAKETNEASWASLSNAQHDFMRTVDFAKAEVADYLRRGVEVKIVANREVPEAPPFALDVVESPGFWIGCFDTVEQAQAIAEKIGLRIAKT